MWDAQKKPENATCTERTKKTWPLLEIVFHISQSHKIDNTDIITNFVYLYIRSFFSSFGNIRLTPEF